ncbi:MAG: SAM-dependent methyltransferase [Chloroflexi bacterium RBG_16_48_8]|nr:MAG: SAM-dependent methyltransferase [Chloroflexi bacterium RBG_16_48_8]
MPGRGRNRTVSKCRSKKTERSAFGSPGRISHDSTSFYNSRLYTNQKQPSEPIYQEQAVPVACLDQIFYKSSETITELLDNCIHFMITSPPYNVQKEYDEDLTLGEYLRLLRKVGEETYRVLVTGGRACINIANLGRKPYIPLHSYIIQEILDIGFLMREIIWDKATSASISTAWGSWLSATNPVLRDVHEYILIFSKASFSRKSDGRESTIDRDEFLSWTKSVWTFPAESARHIGHPAPFPEELPKRLIELYTYRGDVILDPFCGSGTTCVAAMKSDRHYVGYEINADYVQLSKGRIDKIRAWES